MTTIHLPNDRSAIPVIADLVVALEAGGYDGLWFGEVNNLDAVVPATLAAAASERADISVLLNTYTRAPATLAMTAATLADLAPGRARIMLGVASPLLVERWNGIPYRRPFARLRDTLRFLRQAFAGGRVDGDFDTWATSGFALAQVPHDPPDLLVAACGPRALALAAEEADGVALNWLAPGDLERVRPLPQERARVSVVVTVCPTDDWDVVDAIARPLMTDYLSAPAYAEQQRRVGRGQALTPMWEAWARGDRSGARACLPSTIIDELVVWGSPATCASRLAAFEADTGTRALAHYLLPPGVDFLASALP